jgi:predicted TIM-barrel fold metal-dependent hydrolase
MLIVDAQVHLWGANTPDRPWPADRSAGAHGESLSAEQMLAWMAEAGVDRAVIVPPSWEGDRNDIALDAAVRYPETFAVMGRLPIEHPASRDQVAGWKQQPGMLGMRFTFHGEQHRRGLRDGTADWLWPLAESAGVPLMVNVPGSVQLMDRVAERHPGLKLTIDHLGNAAHKKDAEAYGETDQLIRLARHPNVSVKATAVARYTAEEYPYPHTQKRLQRIFDAFGPTRFFWGSDISSLPCTYRQAVTLFTEELSWLSPRDKELVMGRAVCDWLDWRF